ncbi:MAG: helix-turn-helix domain-containing protein [Paludibaculum sp.]
MFPQRRFGSSQYHGYEAVSMEQIAAEADVAKATLYNHFPVKEALIAHRFREDIAADMAQRTDALSAYRTFDERMRYLLRESAAWHSARKTYLPHYIRFLVNQGSGRRKPRAVGTTTPEPCRSSRTCSTPHSNPERSRRSSRQRRSPGASSTCYSVP